MNTRIIFVYNLLDLKSDTIKDVLRIPKILTFVEWMYSNVKNDKITLNPIIKKLLPST